MSHAPVRRSQMIAPFGVGAMMNTRDGVSLISGGLDHWYSNSPDGENCEEAEFIIHEWRLQRMLGVDHFRLPPDFRSQWGYDRVPNRGLTMPFLRFPQWHYCPSCGTMVKYPLTVRSRVRCPQCKSSRRTRYLVQVPYVAICDHGHIHDFPWLEWVHRSANPDCRGPLKLITTGRSTLMGQMVRCGCGAHRSLSQITAAGVGGQTFLSANLDASGNPFLCRGSRPWLGTEEGESCNRPIRAALRSASNVYYPQVKSAILLPRGRSGGPDELIAAIENHRVAELTRMLAPIGREPSVSELRNLFPSMFNRFSDEEIRWAYDLVYHDSSSGEPDFKMEGEDIETAFRREEFEILRSACNEESLRTRELDMRLYGEAIAEYISRIVLVEKVRETRALAGFTRIYPETGQSVDDLKRLMWRSITPGNWLPAYVVYGEGIFLEFNEARIREWLENPMVDTRISPLVARYGLLQQNRHLRDRRISARFVMLHTFSHIIMNRLAFDCGYNSASLRERLYVSDDPHKPMCGVLIYTASGDSEGTLGGLVRMGKPEYFGPLLRRAITEAVWCAADPVCMEMGDRGGQGPDSCNLAACHNCSLVPETACEEFNRFLDRGLLVGKPDSKELGYFTFK